MQGIKAMLLRRAGLALVATALGVLGSAGVASAATYAVNDTTDAPLAASGDTNCVSTHGATCTLRAAVQAADNSGGANTITLPAGTYTLSIPSAGANDPSTGDLNVQPGTSGSPVQITLNGSGSGSAIINANQIDRAFSVEASSSSTNNGLTLKGLTIENGLPSLACAAASGNGPCHNGYGGAVYSNGDLALTGDVNLTNNSAPYQDNGSNAYSGYGGGIYSDSQGTLSVSGATFGSNSTYEEGGAVYDDSPQRVLISGSTFNSNSASNSCGGAVSGEYGPLTVTSDSFSNNTAYCGGALYYDNNQPLNVTTSSFTANTSSNDGGAIEDDDSSNATITYDKFSGNSGAYGGALAEYSGNSYSLDHSEFDNNTASSEGGAIDSYASLTSDGSTFLKNSAADGGALGTSSYCYNGFAYEQYSQSLTNATLSQNTATNGGGLYYGSRLIYGSPCTSNPQPLDLVNDTVFSNSASSSGGGVWTAAPGFYPSNVGVQNTIIAKNAGGDCVDGSGGSQFSSKEDAGYNLDSDSSCFGGTGAPGDKTNTDPLLAGPADNGGPVFTAAELPGSPAIDAGTDANCPTTDARGVARPQGASCDMGAFETTLGAGRLTVAKTAPSSVKAGTQFTYTINVGNRGPGVSSGTVMTDQLPANTTLVALNPSRGSCSHSGSPAKVVCQLGTLASGSGASVQILVSISKAGTVKNIASASNDQGSSALGSAITRVTPNYLGALLLDSTTLHVTNGRVYAPFTCRSSKRCTFRFTIIIHAQVKRTHKIATLLFTSSRTKIKSIRAFKTVTESAAVNKASLRLLEKASNHRLTGRLTTRPRTNQKGLIKVVALILG